MPEPRFRRSGLVPNWWIVLQICEFVGMVAVAGAIARLAADGISQALLWVVGIGTIVGGVRPELVAQEAIRLPRRVIRPPRHEAPARYEAPALPAVPASFTARSTVSPMSAGFRTTR